MKSNTNQQHRQSDTGITSLEEGRNELQNFLDELETRQIDIEKLDEIQRRYLGVRSTASTMVADNWNQAKKKRDNIEKQMENGKLGETLQTESYAPQWAFYDAWEVVQTQQNVLTWLDLLSQVERKLIQRFKEKLDQMQGARHIEDMVESAKEMLQEQREQERRREQEKLTTFEEITEDKLERVRTEADQRFQKIQQRVSQLEQQRSIQYLDMLEKFHDIIEKEHSEDIPDDITEMIPDEIQDQIITRYEDNKLTDEQEDKVEEVIGEDNLDTPETPETTDTSSTNPTPTGPDNPTQPTGPEGSTPEPTDQLNNTGDNQPNEPEPEAPDFGDAEPGNLTTTVQQRLGRTQSLTDMEQNVLETIDNLAHKGEPIDKNAVRDIVSPRQMACPMRQVNSLIEDKELLNPDELPSLIKEAYEN